MSPYSRRSSEVTKRSVTNAMLWPSGDHAGSQIGVRVIGQPPHRAGLQVDDVEVGEPAGEPRDHDPPLIGRPARREDLAEVGERTSCLMAPLDGLITVSTGLSVLHRREREALCRRD